MAFFNSTSTEDSFESLTNVSSWIPLKVPEYERQNYKKGFKQTCHKFVEGVYKGGIMQGPLMLADLQIVCLHPNDSLIVWILEP